MSVQNLSCDKIFQGIAGPDRIANITATDLQRVERQLIPLLNTVRLMQGKQPIIVPNERGVKVNDRGGK